MPFTLPTAATAGSVLTATNYNQAVRSNAMFGMATFTNEAARDAALTSPEEGMMAYLTASTVATASGATTAIPTGVTTVYNGSAWVCITPVAAFSNTSGTHNTSSYVTTLTGDGTAVSVTLATGTTALILGQNQWSPSTAATVTVAVSVSGATTIAAASSNALTSFAQGNGNFNTVSPLLIVLTGLTAGTNTFTLNYATSAGTVTFTKRYLTVQGIA